MSKIDYSAGSSQIKINGHDYEVLGAQQIIVGKANPESQEIVKDAETGLNYSRNRVESYEVYNIAKKRPKNWFILDLETGSRGWYPGCEIHGAIKELAANVHTQPNEESEVTTALVNSLVKVLDATDIKQLAAEKWYHIAFGNVVGYVKKEYISDLKYSDPFK